MKPGVKVPLNWIEQALLSAMSPDEVLASIFDAGQQNRITSQGELISMLVMTAATIRDALKLGRFMPLISTVLSLEYEESEDAGYLFIHCQSGSPLMDDAINLYMAAALGQLAINLTGQDIGWQTLISRSCPSALKDDSRLEQWQFNAAINCLVIPLHYLDRPSRFADTIAHNLAHRTCETALQNQQHQLALPQHITLLLDAGKIGFGRDDALNALHLSRSTLNRQLAKHGTTYAQILKEWRLNKARQLLVSSRLSLSEIAERLGYSDASNFTHAFQGWLGVSPSVFRQEHRQKNLRVFITNDLAENPL